MIFWNRLKERKLVIYTSYDEIQYKPKTTGYFK
jgi:hypothetical protein